MQVISIDIAKKIIINFSDFQWVIITYKYER